MSEQGVLLPWRKVARELGVSEVSMYMAIKAGKIPTVRVGRRIYVTSDWYSSLLEKVHRCEQLW